MANANRPSGFSPVAYLNGAKWSAGGNIYRVAAADANSFAIGDVVTLIAGTDANGIPNITRATAGSPMVGVWQGGGSFAKGGAYVDPTNLDTNVIPATKTKDYYGLVIDDPNVIFEAQENGSVITSSLTHLNLNFVAANPATGVRVSAFQLDDTTLAATATLNFKILRLAQRVDNALGLNAKWWVKPNNHYFQTGIASF